MLDYTTVGGTFLGNMALGERRGQLSVSVSKGQLTGQLRLDGRTVPVRGKLSAEGRLTVNLPAWVGSQLLLNVDGEQGEEVILARVDTGAEVTLLPVDVTGKGNDRFAMDGWRFNQAMVSGANFGGFASANATASGVLRFTGRLADGRPFTASARAVRDPLDDILMLPVLTRLAKGAGEIWGDLLLTQAPTDGLHLSGQLMVRLPLNGPTQELNVHGMRWEPKSRVNLMNPGAIVPVGIEASVAGQEAVTLGWPLSNRLANQLLGWQITGNSVTGAFSGRIKNTQVNGTLGGVLFPGDINLGELGTAVRGVGLFTTKAASQRVLIVVP